LVGAIRLGDDGARIVGPGQALPYLGKGSLRRFLLSNEFLAPFADLPSKENGLDIEGFAILKGRAFVGLRGPLVDSIAVVSELEIAHGLRIVRKSAVAHFLDLNGLGVRDLT